MRHLSLTIFRELITMSKKELIYKNVAALKPVEKVLDEATIAVNDLDRTINSSDIPEVLGAAAGIGVGGAIGFAGLYFGGTVGLSAVGITSGLATAGLGAGMVAGIGVLAAPAAILGIGGYALFAHRNKKKLIEKKEMLLQHSMQKQNAIIRSLKEETNANGERVEYLTSLNTLLQAIINDLNADLSQAA
jgi:hypothetical protein